MPAFHFRASSHAARAHVRIQEDLLATTLSHWHFKANLLLHPWELARARVAATPYPFPGRRMKTVVVTSADPDVSLYALPFSLWRPVQAGSKPSDEAQLVGTDADWLLKSLSGFPLKAPHCSHQTRFRPAMTRAFLRL